MGIAHFSLQPKPEAHSLAAESSCLSLLMASLIRFLVLHFFNVRVHAHETRIIHLEKDILSIVRRAGARCHKTSVEPGSRH